MRPEIFKMALVLGSLSWIGPFAIDMYLPAMPIIAEDLDASVSASQATLMAFFLSFGASQLFYGPASDVLGRKRPLYFGLSLFAAASFGCALAPSISWLIALRFIQGVGAAAVMSIPRAVIRDCYVGNEATRLMSTVMLIIAISPMFAPLLGSAVIVPFGWRAIFIAVAAASLVGFAMAIFGLRETLPPERRRPFRLRAMSEAFATLFADTRFLGLTFIGAMGMSSFFAFLATSSFLYMEHYGLTPVQYSLAFALNALGFFSASQTAANLEARFGAVRVIRAAVGGFCASALTALILVLSGHDNLPLLATMLFITYAFLGLVLPTSMVLALEAHGPIAGTASSLGGTLQMMTGAGVIAILSSGFAVTPLTLSLAIAACAIVAALLAMLTLSASEDDEAGEGGMGLVQDRDQIETAGGRVSRPGLSNRTRR